MSNWWPAKPDDRVDSGTWRLDVVTLLAVIGESSMTDHAQAITASALCLLPRVLPAPQVLLKPSRPLRMPQTPAKVCGVFSGVVLDTVGFFANIIHPLDKMEPFEFKVLHIRHRRDNELGDIVIPPQARAAAQGVWRRVSNPFVKDKQPGGSEPPQRIPGPPPLSEDESTLREKDNEKEKQTETEEAANNESSQKGCKASSSNNSPSDGPVPEDDARSQVTRATGLSFAKTPGELEQGREPEFTMRRRTTTKARVQDFVANPTLATTQKRPAIPAALYSPIHILGVFSMFLTVGLLVAAVAFSDGPAIVAVSLISVQSTIVGFASWWKPILMKRSHTNEVPRGDVMIRTREGAFVYIKCTEEVARELYLAGTEDCKYRVGERTYRLLMGVGTIMLMVSVVLLGNCSWNMQLFVGSSYISLNALYWAMGMLPRRMFWDLSRYKWEWVTPDDAVNAHVSTKEDDPKYDPREGVVSFTRTLWFAIRETGLTGWVERSGAAPATEQWKQWLQEAQDAAQRKDRGWNAVGRKDDIFRTSTWGREVGMPRNGQPTPVFPPPVGPAQPGSPDPGLQHAPLTEVQGMPTGNQPIDRF